MKLMSILFVTAIGFVSATTFAQESQKSSSKTNAFENISTIKPEAQELQNISGEGARWNVAACCGNKVSVPGGNFKFKWSAR